jgi:hypothetical protein
MPVHAHLSTPWVIACCPPPRPPTVPHWGRKVVPGRLEVLRRRLPSEPGPQGSVGGVVGSKASVPVMGHFAGDGEGEPSLARALLQEEGLPVEGGYRGVPPG